MNAVPFKMSGANGYLTLATGAWGLGEVLVFYGGPYDNRPEGTFGVSVRAEKMEGRTCDVWLPIQDFSIPPAEATPAIKEAIKKCIEAAINGKIVYIGCMGGMGRTGLFMSLLAKTMGVAQPVAFVRDHYYLHAVETKDQFAYVQNFEVEDIRWWLLKTTLKAWGRHWMPSWVKA